MSRAMFILDRLKEPGSIRSLVLMLFMLRGQALDEGKLQIAVDAMLAILAGISFLMPAVATSINTVITSTTTATTNPGSVETDKS